jgi:hypothetical protein
MFKIPQDIQFPRFEINFHVRNPAGYAIPLFDIKYFFISHWANRFISVKSVGPVTCDVLAKDDLGVVGGSTLYHATFCSRVVKKVTASHDVVHGSSSTLINAMTNPTVQEGTLCGVAL